MRRLILLACLAACEPAKSMLDDSPGGGALDCATVADKIRESYTEAQREAFLKNPQLARWFEITQRVIRESCDEDRWPDAVKQCAVTAKRGQLAECNQLMPPGLQDKLQARMLAAKQAIE